MKPYIGVNNVFRLFFPSLLKREALLFDQLAMISAAGYLDGSLTQFPKEQRLLAWLLESGIVFEPSVPSSLSKEDDTNIRLAWGHLKRSVQMLVGTEKRVETPEEALTHLANLETSAKSVPDSERLLFVGSGLVASGYLTRVFAAHLRRENIDAYPILEDEISSEQIAGKNNVIQVVLKGLPTPDDETPWEHISEFRSDPDSKAKFLDLRHWMSEIARDSLSRAEIEEKLEYLMSRYLRHMQLHKMKTNTSVLETTVVSTGEVIENLVRIKWGKLAKMLFSIKQRRIALLEGELTAPGSEVAYVIKTKETFKQDR